MKKRKPNTIPVWIVAGVMIVVFTIFSLLPATTSKKQESVDDQQNSPATTDEAEVGMANVYGDHISKFPSLWRTSATAKDYEVEESWFQHCLANEAVFMGYLYEPGLKWIRSEDDTYTDQIKAGTGITYKMGGQKDTVSVEITVEIVNSPVSRK